MLQISISWIAVSFHLLAAGWLTNPIVPESSMDWLKGSWEGTGLQINPSNHTWEIIFAYTPGQELPFSINYPSIPCSGNWTIESHEFHRVVFTEKITEGYFRCADNGKVIVTYVDDNHISFTYFLSGSEKLDSYATLKRMVKEDL